jgi:hypothetical protein
MQTSEAAPQSYWGRRTTMTGTRHTTISLKWVRIDALTIPLVNLPPGYYRMGLERCDTDPRLPDPCVRVTLASDGFIHPKEKFFVAEGFDDWPQATVEITLSNPLTSGELFVEFRAEEAVPNTPVAITSACLLIERVLPLNPDQE